jgi:hypothetical protein
MWLYLVVLTYVFGSVAVRTWRMEKAKRKKYLLRQAGMFLGFYLCVLVLLMFAERWLIFGSTSIPEDWHPPSEMGVQEVWLDSKDGARIHAFWCPTPQARCVMLYSHGSVGNIAGRLPMVPHWQREAQASVLLYDYPNFGRSTGTPNEASCYAAGQAAYDWLRTEQQVPAEQIVLYGKSLGSGITVELAMHNPHRALC